MKREEHHPKEVALISKRPEPSRLRPISLAPPEPPKQQSQALNAANMKWTAKQNKFKQRAKQKVWVPLLVCLWRDSAEDQAKQKRREQAGQLPVHVKEHLDVLSSCTEKFSEALSLVLQASAIRVDQCIQEREEALRKRQEDEETQREEAWAAAKPRLLAMFQTMKKLVDEEAEKEVKAARVIQRAWRAWVERGERALDALPPADLQALLSPQGLAMVRDAKARMAKAAAARRARVRAKTLAMAACLGLGAGIKGLGPGSKGLASGASTCRSAKSGRSVLGSRPESVAAGATSPGGRGAVAGSGGPSRKKAVPQRAAFGVGDKAHALSITKEPVAARAPDSPEPGASPSQGGVWRTGALKNNMTMKGALRSSPTMSHQQAARIFQASLAATRKAATLATAAAFALASVAINEAGQQHRAAAGSGGAGSSGLPGVFMPLEAPGRVSGRGFPGLGAAAAVHFQEADASAHIIHAGCVHAMDGDGDGSGELQQQRLAVEEWIRGAEGAGPGSRAGSGRSSGHGSHQEHHLLEPHPPPGADYSADASSSAARTTASSGPQSLASSAKTHSSSQGSQHHHHHGRQLRVRSADAAAAAAAAASRAAAAAAGARPGPGSDPLDGQAGAGGGGKGGAAHASGGVGAAGSANSNSSGDSSATAQLGIPAHQQGSPGSRGGMPHSQHLPALQDYAGSSDAHMRAGTDGALVDMQGSPMQGVAQPMRPNLLKLKAHLFEDGGAGAGSSSAPGSPRSIRSARGSGSGGSRGRGLLRMSSSDSDLTSHFSFKMRERLANLDAEDRDQSPVAWGSRLRPDSAADDLSAARAGSPLRSASLSQRAFLAQHRRSGFGGAAAAANAGAAGAGGGGTAAADGPRRSPRSRGISLSGAGMGLAAAAGGGREDEAAGAGRGAARPGVGEGGREEGYDSAGAGTVHRQARTTGATFRRTGMSLSAAAAAAVAAVDEEKRAAERAAAERAASRQARMAGASSGGVAGAGGAFAGAGGTAAAAAVVAAGGSVGQAHGGIGGAAQQQLRSPVAASLAEALSNQLSLVKHLSDSGRNAAMAAAAREAVAREAAAGPGAGQGHAGGSQQQAGQAGGAAAGGAHQTSSSPQQHVHGLEHDPIHERTSVGCLSRGVDGHRRAAGERHIHFAAPSPPPPLEVEGLQKGSSLSPASSGSVGLLPASGGSLGAAEHGSGGLAKEGSGAGLSLSLGGLGSPGEEDPQVRAHAHMYARAHGVPYHEALAAVKSSSRAVSRVASRAGSRVVSRAGSCKDRDRDRDSPSGGGSRGATARTGPGAPPSSGGGYGARPWSGREPRMQRAHSDDGSSQSGSERGEGVSPLPPARAVSSLNTMRTTPSRLSMNGRAGSTQYPSEPEQQQVQQQEAQEVQQSNGWAGPAGAVGAGAAVAAVGAGLLGTVPGRGGFGAEGEAVEVVAEGPGEVGGPNMSTSETLAAAAAALAARMASSALEAQHLGLVMAEERGSQGEEERRAGAAAVAGHDAEGVSPPAKGRTAFEQHLEKKQPWFTPVARPAVTRSSGADADGGAAPGVGAAPGPDPRQAWADLGEGCGEEGAEEDPFMGSAAWARVSAPGSLTSSLTRPGPNPLAAHGPGGSSGGGMAGGAPALPGHMLRAVRSPGRSPCASPTPSVQSQGSGQTQARVVTPVMVNGPPAFKPRLVPNGYVHHGGGFHHPRVKAVSTPSPTPPPGLPGTSPHNTQQQQQGGMQDTTASTAKGALSTPYSVPYVPPTTPPAQHGVPVALADGPSFVRAGTSAVAAAAGGLSQGLSPMAVRRSGQSHPELGSVFAPGALAALREEMRSSGHRPGSAGGAVGPWDADPGSDSSQGSGVHAKLPPLQTIGSGGSSDSMGGGRGGASHAAEPVQPQPPLQQPAFRVARTSSPAGARRFAGPAAVAVGDGGSPAGGRCSPGAKALHSTGFQWQVPAQPSPLQQQQRQK